MNKINKLFIKIISLDKELTSSFYIMTNQDKHMRANPTMKILSI